MAPDPIGGRLPAVSDRDERGTSERLSSPSNPVTAQARAIDEMNPDGVPRKVLLVAGAGRSGTSTMAGIASKLGHARAAARGAARRVQPAGLLRAAVGRRPPRPAAQGGRRPGQRLAPERVVRDRPHLHARARPDPGRRVARAALRRTPRAGREGPAAELVPRPVAGRRDPHRRQACVRDDAASPGRGRRQQAEVLREQARVGAPRRELAQHAAPHRARDARGGGFGAGVRALRGPAGRLGEDDDARRPHPRPAVDRPHAAAISSARCTASSTRPCDG